MKMKQPAIGIRGAAQNNLKRLDLDIPLNRFTVVTGVSGSGKSSLAFDTLYAEGQRRYVETFSPYARQFMDRMDRPRARRIDNIPPAIAIDRKDPVRTSRSTVGTMTEVTDYVKLLFARSATLYCGGCNRPVHSETPARVWEAAVAAPPGRELVLTFPYEAGDVGPERARRALTRLGYDRILAAGRMTYLEEMENGALPGRLDVVADRLRAADRERGRIMDSAELAFRFGSGRTDLWLDGRRIQRFNSRLACAGCSIDYAPPLPNRFSFNSPLGACDTCRGFGRVIDIDLDLIIPDPALTLAQGAIKPFGEASDRRMEYRDLATFCRGRKIPLDRPFRSLKKAQRRAIIDGTDHYYGIRGFFAWLETRTYKMPVRVFLSRYRSYNVCPDCGGARFKPETLRFRLADRTIADVYALDVDRAAAYFDHLAQTDADAAGRMVLDEIRGRLEYLQDVGLGFLTLDRQSRTLSGGEVQRVALASALGSSLVNTLYVLDEPSIGLHPRDSHRLVRILRRLRRRPNTVVVVEHDPEIIRHSDYLLDLGPQAGDAGGRVMYFGPTGRVGADDGQSLTGQYLTGRRQIPLPETRRQPKRGHWLTLSGAAENNLCNLEVKIPLDLFVCLTGVSGSGKSTLAEEILYKAVKREKGGGTERPGRYRRLSGLAKISDAVLVDQRAIGRTPRANSLTYTKALDPVRKLFAGTEGARQFGFGPGHFSFNVAGGRCETCKGDGFEKIEMQFLSDVYVTCPDCLGKRFSKDVLSVSYRGKSIHDILDMTVDHALDFFADQKRIQTLLTPLARVGLGYVRLGQPVSTLSGGEAQRLKLSRYVGDTTGGRLFIFDEPTTGLHFEDIRILLIALQQLVDAGNTVLIIEHNMEVVKCADWVIDLGPEGGDRGGRLVAAGSPETVAGCADSHTGQYLAPCLGPESGYTLAGDRPAAVAEAPASPGREIVVQGAREHNLKNLSLTVPRNRLVALTGVSGSGKSTLAFDILFEEGQRRYLESLAPYVRQYMKVLERPDVDLVTGLSPTVAIEQRISHASRRSTVATLTEIYHFLRLLFSKVGTQHCPVCDRPLEARRPSAIQEEIRQRYTGKRVRILAPKVAGRKGFHKDVLADALKKGYTEARIDGGFTRIAPGMALSRYQEHTIEVVVGRLTDSRLGVLVETALKEGDGSLVVADGRGRDAAFSVQGICPTCGVGLETLDPRLFSFNSSQGACPACHGLGEIGEEEKGAGDPCPACGGSRLRPEALAVRVGGHSLWDLVRLPAGALVHAVDELAFSSHQLPVAWPVVAEVLTRLRLLARLGLSYLSLSRSGNTLSGGEAQRVRLAAQLGSNLTGVCYILDEPTIGLHPRDNRMLLDALVELRDRGNTILVVEHDEATIRAADHVIDLGPGAGENGGEVVAQGTLADLRRADRSMTGALLDGVADRMPIRRRKTKGRAKITVRGACANNLKDIDVDFPLNTLIAVTGVSGSGKSTLLKTTLFEGLKAMLAGGKKRSRRFRRIIGAGNVDRVREVDHTPIGRTPRSVPASYVGFLDEIRRIFAMTPAARERGYKPGRFSFNVADGRCEACKGQGTPRIEMSFLPDVYVPCEICGGRRYNRDTLAVTYKGRNMAEVLEMTFAEAARFFSAVPVVRQAVQFVCDIGLGYLRLGQPSPTLSGGEAQRIKLARQLYKPVRGHTLYILDEPTTGLHPADVHLLLAVLQSLVDAGNTVAVIEHNLEIVRQADWVIDLGPEGGDGGGAVVAACTPAQLSRKTRISHTARELKKYLHTKGNVK
jgi:excinuclease ABC subunit A